MRLFLTDDHALAGQRDRLGNEFGHGQTAMNLLHLEHAAYDTRHSNGAKTDVKVLGGAAEIDRDLLDVGTRSGRNPTGCLGETIQHERLAACRYPQ